MIAVYTPFTSIRYDESVTPPEMRGPGGSAARAPRECEYALTMINVGSIRGRRSRRPASRLPASRLTAALVAGTALAGGLAALVPAGPARADQPGGIMNSVDMIGARALWERGITGQGTVVVVIDSGVETSHPFLEGKVVDEACVGISAGGQTGDCGGGATDKEAAHEAPSVAAAPDAANNFACSMAVMSPNMRVTSARHTAPFILYAHVDKPRGNETCGF